MSQPAFVILVGGPPRTPQIRAAPPVGDRERVKIQRGNGYEHFESTDECAEFDGELIPVYRWCYRTFIAE
ncbi:DUF5988 family protein [Streptomyces sp. NPDC005355]|uniref:DUF5988 family protein n=1 Tax=Streptomyces sp. NPDC005355 TaxID=3157038 RepID=UPI0033A583D3